VTGSFFDATLRGLASAMSLHERRHEVLASNLANVETPGFRARDLDFGTALREAFAEPTDPALALDPERAASVIEDPNTPARADGNTVDLELQMVQLTANSGRYNTLARLLGKRLGILRAAIEGSR